MACRVLVAASSWTAEPQAARGPPEAAKLENG
jgi:hypothetical protein